MQVSTTCRSTVNRWIGEACGSSRIRSHSGRICASAPVSSSVSHTAEQPAARGQQPHQQLAGARRPGIGQRRRLAGQPGGGGRREHGVALGRLGRGPQQEQRVLGRPRPGRPARPRPTESASPGAIGVRSGRRGRAARPVARARRPRVATSAGTGGSSGGRSRARDLRRRVVRRGRARAPGRPTPPGRPGRCARPVDVVQHVADVEQRRRLRSSSTCGTSTSQEATSALRTVASRSPPAASFRSGTDRCASSPTRSWRVRTRSWSAGSRARASRRHRVSMVVRSRSVRLGSPARCRTSSSPSATFSSSSAAATISGRLRTAWSSLVPLSHSGYQRSSAARPGATSSSCTRTTSRSEYGASSPRPYPPTATSETPTTGAPAFSNASTHRASAAAVRSDRGARRHRVPRLPESVR